MAAPVFLSTPIVAVTVIFAVIPSVTPVVFAVILLVAPVIFAVIPLVAPVIFVVAAGMPRWTRRPVAFAAIAMGWMLKIFLRRKFSFFI